MEEPLSPALGPSARRNYPHKYTISKGCNCLHAYGHSCLISFSISLDFPGTITGVRRTSGLAPLRLRAFSSQNSCQSRLEAMAVVYAFTRAIKNGAPA